MQNGFWHIRLCTALLIILLAESECKAETAYDAQARATVTIPVANPLRGFDASTSAWNGASQLFAASTRFVAGAADLDESLKGRFAYLALSAYLDYAAKYYAHEIAHRFHQKTDSRNFKLDLSDWSHFVPKLELGMPWDCWDPQELEEYVRSNDPKLDARIRRWLILMDESGLYQEKFNARSAAQYSARSGSTTVSSAVSFIVNHIGDFSYNLFYGNDPITITRIDGYTLMHINDINGYISTMREMGIPISRNDWLIVSFLTFAGSGQTWNSTRASYRYIVSGERIVDNWAWSISDRFALSPPNFYLFPTYRGLYLESETCVNITSSDNRRLHVALGTGLDSFGLNQAGMVDRIRIGGIYDAMDLRFGFVAFSLSPYCYTNLDRRLKHRGQSVGADLFFPVGSRFSLRGTIEYNRNDMIEGIIKNKDEGMYFLAALGFDL
jgi:hypothetical protein